MLAEPHDLLLEPHVVMPRKQRYVEGKKRSPESPWQPRGGLDIVAQEELVGHVAEMANINKPTGQGRIGPFASKMSLEK